MEQICGTLLCDILIIYPVVFGGLGFFGFVLFSSILFWAFLLGIKWKTLPSFPHLLSISKFIDKSMLVRLQICKIAMQ